jgi:hypothetical protein
MPVGPFQALPRRLPFTRTNTTGGLSIAAQIQQATNVMNCRCAHASYTGLRKSDGSVIGASEPLESANQASLPILAGLSESLSTSGPAQPNTKTSGGKRATQAASLPLGGWEGQK